MAISTIEIFQRLIGIGRKRRRTKSSQLNVRIPDTELAEMKARCERLGISEARAVRTGLALFAREHDAYEKSLQNEGPSSRTES